MEALELFVDISLLRCVRVRVSIVSFPLDCIFVLWFDPNHNYFYFSLHFNATSMQCTQKIEWVCLIDFRQKLLKTVYWNLISIEFHSVLELGDSIYCSTDFHSFLFAQCVCFVFVHWTQMSIAWSVAFANSFRRENDRMTAKEWEEQNKNGKHLKRERFKSRTNHLSQFVWHSNANANHNSRLINSFVVQKST